MKHFPLRRNADEALRSVAAILIALAIPACARAYGANSPSSVSQDSSSSQSKPDNSDKRDKPDKSDKQNKNDKDAAPAMTRIKIQVNDSNDKPVSNASVYIGFYQSGGLLHHDKMAELDLKTNQDGSVRVPEIPQGKIRIQVLAKGWHTFGQWYDIEKPEDLVQIKLLPPPHWY